MNGVRAFVAVKISEDVRNALWGIIGELQGSRVDVRWVRSANLHITLKFLGNVETARIPAVEEALRKGGAGLAPFSLPVRGIDALPNPKYPRIVYADLADERGSLKKLAESVCAELEPLGFEPEKRDFLPHLTLGRVKSFRGKTMLMMKIREYHNREIGSILVKDFLLMKSELKPGGAIYSDIARIPLTSGGEHD